MKLTTVQEVLEAKVIYGNEFLDKEALNACGADLMSDVLVFTKCKTLLLTGLNNVQVIRTAEISDLVGIVFVRGKEPNEAVIEAAKKDKLPLFSTKLTLYEASGVLYSHGLRGCEHKIEGGGVSIHER